MKIVSISGLDGSGKSTQNGLLKSYLESRGKKVFYFHAVSYSLPNLIMSLIKSRRRDEALPRLYPAASVTRAGWFTIILRKIALRIDLFRFIFLILKLKHEKIDYLLSDRYFFDNVININFLSGKENWNWKIAQPALAVYLKTDPEEIMQRERIPEQGIEYLKKKKDLYDKAAEIWNMKIIDGNQNKERIFEEIKVLVSELNQK